MNFLANYQLKLKPFLFGIIYFVLLLNNFAQNQYGLTTGNYAGIHHLQVNPANIAYQPYSLDFNLVSVDGNITNNNYYTEAKFLPWFIFNDHFNKLVPKDRSYNENRLKDGDIVVKNAISSNGFVFGGVNLVGPSVLISLTKKKSLAISTGLRSHLSITNISKFAALAAFEGLTYRDVTYQDIQMKNTKVAFATWAEIGLSYAQVIKESYHFMHRFGFTVKGLFGLNGGYLIDNGIKGVNENGKDLILNNASFAYAYAGPKTNSIDVNTAKTDYSIRGLGMCFDIGYAIERKNYSSTRYCPNMYGFTSVNVDYKWKAGISLLDLGIINFFKQSFYTQVNNGNVRWSEFDTTSNREIFEIDALFRSKITGSVPNVQNAFSMILPSTINLQFDYRLNSFWFINAMFIQRLTTAQLPSLSRMNSFSIVPRFETMNSSVFVPVYLSEYQYFNWGLAYRYKFFTIGSDRLAETFGLKQAFGADFYAAIKYNFEHESKRVKKLF
jgi:hypothetical protein